MPVCACMKIGGLTAVFAVVIHITVPLQEDVAELPSRLAKGFGSGFQRINMQSLPLTQWVRGAPSHNIDTAFGMVPGKTRRAHSMAVESSKFVAHFPLIGRAV
jgi:hypothetical protein